jgi:hypothetical protein
MPSSSKIVVKEEMYFEKTDQFSPSLPYPTLIITIFGVHPLHALVPAHG